MTATIGKFTAGDSVIYAEVLEGGNNWYYVKVQGTDQYLDLSGTKWTFEEVTIPPWKIVRAMKPGTVFRSSGNPEKLHVRLPGNLYWVDGIAVGDGYTYVITSTCFAEDSVITIVKPEEL